MSTHVTDRYERMSLPAGARPIARYTYYVTGRGTFPFDMLRYDCAYPERGEDAAELDDNGRGLVMRSIKLVSHREPTIDRWSSFGWSVGRYKING